MNLVPRTCTEVPRPDGGQSGEETYSRPLAEFRSTPAYVLLGDPGAGKTTVFESEREALGDPAHFVTARDFVTLEPEHHPEWRRKTLFIDGLDEIRAGRPDARTPFDAIRGRLDMLGRPCFRLSCREADWLGENDRKRLESVSPGNRITVLRLDPLGDQDIEAFLGEHPRVPDATDFVRSARERAIGGLLANPQSLGMLADTVTIGGWPESRRALFESACERMVEEHNEEHRVATSPVTSAPVPAGFLDAAGRLCALLLISGKAGYGRHNDGSADDYVGVGRCGGENVALLRQVLSTKLFKAESTGSNRFVPVHRHIAEYLGARYLAQCIRDGLPARRVLALLTGEDDGVVTELRGLSAWLAVHSREARRELITCDPVGVGLYGDLGEFSTDEKHELLRSLHQQQSSQQLLDSLYQEASRFGSAASAASAFGPLVTTDTESILRDSLCDPCRDDDHQDFVVFVLRVLAHGAPLPGLAGLLLDMVRDESWSPSIRTFALDAFLHNRTSGPCGPDVLMDLLRDVHAGQVSDPDEELLGTLLTKLYPNELSPSEIWNFLSEREQESPVRVMRRSYTFWEYRLVEKSTPDQITEHLDILTKQHDALRPALESHWFRRLPLALLARGLETRGDDLSPARLYDWLGIGLPSDRHSFDHDESVFEIRSWLEQRPGLRKAILAEALRRCAGTSGFDFNPFKLKQCLYGASLPSDFGLWCLEQALVTNDPKLARLLLSRAADAVFYRTNDEGLSLDVLEERTRDHELSDVLPGLLVHRLRDDYWKRRGERRRYREEDERRRQEWADAVRANETALRENRCSPWLLHQIASVYAGGHVSAQGDDPITRLGNLVGNDKQLVEAMLAGLRGVPYRDDIPGVEEVIALNRKGRLHFLAYPFLAGLLEIERTCPEPKAVSVLDENQLRKALVFHYCVPDTNAEDRWWYRQLVAERPEMVADVLVRFAASEIRYGKGHVHRLYPLAHMPNHARVAHHASLPLLRTFPIRCAKRHLDALDHLLWAALQHAAAEPLRVLIGEKLSRRSMNVAQHVHWLAAGLVAAPDIWLDSLEAFVGNREERIRQLATFFCSDPPWPFLIERLEPPALKLLIRLLGSWFGPDARFQSGLVTLPKKASVCTHTLLQRLAALPGADAGVALQALLSDEALSAWRNELLRARNAQQVVGRDAGYHHPSIERILGTLENRLPANTVDLAALVVDRLGEIAHRIRNGNTDDWRQYWNENPHGRPRKSKHEDSCRDALLSDLRERLPAEIDAQPEGKYANDNRADMRIAFGGFQVPVEIKKNGHPDLWRALREQLIAKYVRDPATGGYGIYLVFWFGDGDDDRTTRPPMGPRPDGPLELKQYLEATLSGAEVRKISICVVDVSAP